MPKKRLQIEVNEQNIWIIGIPEKGDLERIEQHCQANGLGSWSGFVAQLKPSKTP